MNILQMQIMFHDILENTSALFATTSERPTSTVVIGYLNEAQNRFFNERYLAGDVIQNITIAKSLKTELRNLLESKTLTLTALTNSYPHAYKIDDNYITWEEFEYYVEGSIRVTRASILATSSASGDFVELLPISALNLNKYITNYTNVPILPQPVIIVDNGLSASPGMVITDQYTTVKTLAGGSGAQIQIVVLKRPTTLSLTAASYDAVCDIDARFHEQIVRLAVEMFLGDKGKFARPQQQTKE